jgi:hypothetical protein
MSIQNEESFSPISSQYHAGEGIEHHADWRVFPQPIPPESGIELITTKNLPETPADEEFSEEKMNLSASKDIMLCGLRRKTFWIFFGVLISLVIAGLGAGIGVLSYKVTQNSRLVLIYSQYFQFD